MNSIFINKNKFDSAMHGEKVNGKNYTYDFIHLLLDIYSFEFINNIDNDNLVVSVVDFFNIKRVKIDSMSNFIDTVFLLFDLNYLNRKEKKLFLNLQIKNNYKKYIDSSNKHQGKKDKYLNNIIELFMNYSDIIKDILKLDYNKREYLRMLKNILKHNNNSNEKIIKEISTIITTCFRNNKIRKPKYLEKIKLDKEFVINIINDIPKKFTDLEKCIYIYIKLCSILTHDPNDLYRNSYTINHKDINRIKHVNENNNVIVCYEFVSILAKILELFNIKYEIGGDIVYGRGHSYLKLLYKDSVIAFDSTRGLINCDLTRTKNNIRICGINPIEANCEIMDEINISIDKIYDYIFEKYNKKYYYENEYLKLINIDTTLDINNKINIFFNNICNTSLEQVDNIKRINLLKKKIFDHDDVSMTIIENRMLKNKSVLNIIFTFCFNNNIKYYIYMYPDNVFEVQKNFIEDGFKNEIFKFINFLNKEIPGISKITDKKMLQFCDSHDQKR